MTEREWVTMSPSQIIWLLLSSAVALSVAALFAFGAAASVRTGLDRHDTVQRAALTHPVSLNDTIYPPRLALQPCDWLYKEGCRE